ncbi:GGDEF domain-containing protein [Vampirovibrio chlorellavorus]|uniref:GGDEF domain-containing protein n=1 Tax=Vampirovibrio chlorellavorus TaxID=758823 RepID=UPI0026EF5A36|nr:GGDEF domain-containing protein [Vampirovibrio chlorellavorus]
MTEIYLLCQQPEAFRARLTTLVGDRFPIKTPNSEAALLEQLWDAPQAVIFSDLPLTELTALLERCRFARAATALIGLLPAASHDAPLPVLDIDCHWVSATGSDFEWLNSLSGAIRQAELLAALSESAQRDEVSNLFSRPYFMSRLTGELSLAKRHQAELSLMVLGLDCYQIYLDSYGYQFVNALLRFLGEQIIGMIRHEDVMARIGDDEIGILLPRSTEAGARTLAARMVTTLNTQVFQQGGYTEEVLVSAGIVSYPLRDARCEDADTLMRYGRHALYHSKADADDLPRVCLFSEIVPTL